MPSPIDSSRTLPHRQTRRFPGARCRVMIPLPPGDLFYPCSGPDLLTPLQLFAAGGRTLHGSDLDRPNHAAHWRHLGLDVELVDVEPHEFEVEGSCSMENSRHNLRNGEGWSPRPCGCREQYRVRSQAESAESWTVFRHRYDAIETLKRLPPLCLVYAVGDRSYSGEGSSGISWLGNALFPRILDKLVPGGLFVTDGLAVTRVQAEPFNGEEEDLDDDSLIADQHPLWYRKPDGWPMADSFTAFGRRMQLVIPIRLEPSGRVLWIWRCE